MLTILGGIAEFERELITIRTAGGREYESHVTSSLGLTRFLRIRLAGSGLK
jgi:DNA invertase Pin-like site-specific DNA recombinase